MPVDEWAEVDKPGSKEHTVDVRQFTDEIWGNRRFIAKITGLFVVLGLIIALISPVGYKVEATLLPESQAVSASGLLQQFGGLLGLGGAGLQGKNKSLPPQLYPKIVKGVSYQVDLLNKDVSFSTLDTTVSLYTYWSTLHTPSVFSTIKSYTLGLPYKIIGLFTEDQPVEPLPNSVSQDSIVTLTRAQLSIVKEMRSHIEIEIDEETGLVNLTVIMSDPQATAEVSDYVITLLKKYVTEYRTDKARQYLAFVKNETQEARADYHQIQNKLAIFVDQHANLVTEQALNEQRRLEAKEDLLFNKYNSLVKRLQQAKLNVQKKSPVLTLLEPVRRPVDNFKPQKKLIVIIFFAIGLVLSVGYVVAQVVIDERGKVA